MNQPIRFNAQSAAILVSVILVSGCATNPENLQAPREITCIDVKEPLSFTGHYGLFNVLWTTRLERGPYWAEKVDEKGTFFRAPPGGVSIRGERGTGIPGQMATSDGGFYVPNNPNEPVTIYRYFTTSDVPVQVPPSDARCSNVAYMKDPSSSKVSLVSSIAGGASGGAAGGIIGRSMSRGSNMSYGQAAGVGAVGGAIGGLIVASIINADVGKIVRGMPIQDAQFMEKLRALAATQEKIKEIQPPAGTDVRSALSATTTTD